MRGHGSAGSCAVAGALLAAAVAGGLAPWASANSGAGERDDGERRDDGVRFHEGSDRRNFAEAGEARSVRARRSLRLGQPRPRPPGRSVARITLRHDSVHRARVGDSLRCNLSPLPHVSIMGLIANDAARIAALDRAAAWFDAGGLLAELSRRVARPTASADRERAPELERYLTDEIGAASRSSASSGRCGRIRSPARRRCCSRSDARTRRRRPC